MAKISNIFPSSITNDFLRKLIALFFALLVWISVKNTIGVEQDLPGEIPVNFTLPSGFVLTNNTPQKVSIKVRASERLLSRLRPELFSINIPINADQYRPNEPINISVKPTDISTPLGVTVVGVKNRDKFVNLDRIISKNVEVIAKFSEPEEGFTSGDVELTPRQVLITGPSNLLAERKTIFTEPIPLSQATESFEYDPKLVTNESIINVSKSRVHAKVEIIPDHDDAIFDNIAIRIMNSPENSELFDIQLEKESVNVQIQGMKSVVELTKSDQIKAFLDIHKLKEPGSYNVNVDCSISGSAASITKILPPTIKVTLTSKR